MPEGVAREFEKIEATFLWSGNDLKRKVHLLKWVEVTKSMDQGGLGIRRIRDVNVCLLLKWWWKFGNQLNALWRKALCSKYKINEECWLPPMASSYKHSRMWKDIISIGAHSRIIFSFFLANCLIKVGDGHRVRFWHDRWCGAFTLKSEFSLIFNLSTDKEGSLHQFYARKTSLSAWNLPYRRVLYAWELDEEHKLVAALSSSPPLNFEREDCIAWGSTSAGPGGFSVSTLYSYSSSHLGPSFRICRFVWSKALPPKVSFFCWLAWKNRIKSADFLHRIGILDSSVPSFCHFCNSVPETAVHVLFHCPFSWLVWSSVIHDWGLLWCIHDSIDGLLYGWMSGIFSNFEQSIWKAIPPVVLWSIWKHRNECVFSEAQPNFPALCELIKIRTALWLKASIKDLPFSVDDLVLRWRQIRGCA